MAYRGRHINPQKFERGQIKILVILLPLALFMALPIVFIICHAFKPMEELFAFPMHPYTKSLISAIPVPDPIIEKSKKLLVYDPSMHDYITEQPELTDLGNGHMVFGSPSEIEKYRKIRFA